MHRESTMSKIASVLPALVLTLLFPAWQPTHCVVQAAEREGIVILVGPSEHPPGTHEVEAGGRVMEYALEHAGNVPGLPAEVLTAWPDDTSILQRAAAVVFIGDIFPPQRLPETARILEQLDAQAKDGLGIACVHYAVGLQGPDVAPDGDHPLLRWIGGYFANRTCPHHESFARVFERATIEPSATAHPIQRGWQPFVIHDEPYYNNYFGTEGNRPAENVTVVATSMLPPEAPRPEAVAWCVERPGGGRGFAVVMPHFYRNWKQDDLRRLILNGIVWTSGREVPEEGVRSELPDLRQFLPASAE
jgi:type 1 glutamine amidotransferase